MGTAEVMASFPSFSNLRPYSMQSCTLNPVVSIFSTCLSLPSLLLSLPAVLGTQPIMLLTIYLINFLRAAPFPKPPIRYLTVFRLVHRYLRHPHAPVLLAG